MKIKKVLLTVAATVCLNAGMWAQTVIPAYVPTNSLVGWWPFNGNANDLSINANNGTVNGATLTADRFGNANKAYSFDGINDYIQVNNSNNTTLSNDFTVITWVNIFSLNTFNAFLSNASNDQPSVSGWVWGYSNFSQPSKRHFQAYPNWNNSTVAQNGNDVVNNNWVHLATTYELSSGKLKYYLNGVLTDTFTTTYSISNSGLNLYIGNHFQNNNPLTPVPTNASFNGKLDDIGIWNRALTACEIKKLYYSPSFTVAASNASICVGQSLTLSAGGVPNYSWSNGANTATTVVTPTASTVYTVTSSYTTGCTDTKTIAVTVNACTGISELTKENTISIYPNPAKESITITSTNALAGKFYVIHDATGKQVAKGILSPEKTSVSLTGLSAGLYILSVEGKLNQTYKFVKE
jgi:hypothetical protein